MRTKLKELSDAGLLMRWTPQIASDPCERTLFVTQEINDEFDEDTWKDPSIAYRYGQLGADFDRFVVGDTLPVGWEPYEKDGSAFIARVDPPEYGVWTIRSCAPKPAIRVFGAFCEQDVFIALISRFRAELGGRNSTQWMRAREDAIARWEQLFPGFERLSGGDKSDFISEKTILV